MYRRLGFRFRYTDHEAVLRDESAGLDGGGTRLFFGRAGGELYEMAYALDRFHLRRSSRAVRVPLVIVVDLQYTPRMLRRARRPRSRDLAPPSSRRSYTPTSYRFAVAVQLVRAGLTDGRAQRLVYRWRRLIETARSEGRTVSSTAQAIDRFDQQQLSPVYSQRDRSRRDDGRGKRPYEVRGVLAGAYRGKDVEDRVLLRHALLPDEEKTLCRRVLEERLCDVDEPEEPTCAVCLERLERLRRRGKL